MSLLLLIDSKNKRTELYQDNKCLFSLNRTSSKITLGLLDTVHFLGHDGVEKIDYFEININSKVYKIPMNLLCCLEDKDDIINSTIREVVNALINKEMKKFECKEEVDVFSDNFIDV